MRQSVCSIPYSEFTATVSSQSLCISVARSDVLKTSPFRVPMDCLLFVNLAFQSSILNF